MTAMDKQNRLTITENIRDIVNLDFTKEIRIYLNITGGNLIILSNNTELDYPCFGIANFDAKYRFFLPKELRKLLRLTHESKLLVYSKRGTLVIHRL